MNGAPPHLPSPRMECATCRLHAACLPHLKQVPACLPADLYQVKEPRYLRMSSYMYRYVSLCLPPISRLTEDRTLSLLLFSSFPLPNSLPIRHHRLAVSVPQNLQLYANSSTRAKAVAPSWSYRPAAKVFWNRAVRLGLSWPYLTIQAHPDELPFWEGPRTGALLLD